MIILKIMKQRGVAEIHLRYHHLEPPRSHPSDNEREEVFWNNGKRISLTNDMPIFSPALQNLSVMKKMTMITKPSHEADPKLLKISWRDRGPQGPWQSRPPRAPRQQTQTACVAPAAKDKYNVN